MRVAFVYPNSRRELLEAVAAGEAPDTSLLGQNHLQALGIDSYVHDSFLRRSTRGPGLLHRLTWHGRELTLPWELRSADVVCTPLATLLPLVARAVRGPKVVLFDWGLGAALARASRTRRSLLRATLRCAAAIVCPSSTQRAHLVEEHGLDGSRVHTVELGADERFFAPTGASRDRFVLAVGKDLARDYETLAAATAEGEFRTVVVAHPRNVTGLAVPPTMEIRHDLSWDELRELYASAACFVLPLRDSRTAVGTDGSGLTALLEAMASGQAVVATRRPVLEAYVDEGRTGLFVPPEDPAALASALTRLLADPARSSELGGAARTAVEQRFTTRALASRLAPIIANAGERRR